MQAEGRCKQLHAFAGCVVDKLATLGQQSLREHGAREAAETRAAEREQELSEAMATVSTFFCPKRQLHSYSRSHTHTHTSPSLSPWQVRALEAEVKRVRVLEQQRRRDRDTAVLICTTRGTTSRAERQATERMPWGALGATLVSINFQGG